MSKFDEDIQAFIEEDIQYIEEQYNILEDLRKDFVSRFPIENIMQMELDDYVVGKGKESFCYWLETKLKGLGSIAGGSPADKKFGVYYNKEQQTYKTIAKWNKDFNHERAFIKIKESIVKLLNAGEKGDLTTIKDNPLSPMFKNKILTSYFPHKFIGVFSEEHVDYFLRRLKVKVNNEQSLEEKRGLLEQIKRENPLTKEMKNDIFTRFLYSRYNPKLKEIRIIPMSEKEFPNMDYKKVQDEFFLGSLLDKNQNNGKYNYRAKGLNAPAGTLILFQFNSQIIASASLIEVVKYQQPKQGVYNGAYVLDKSSIHVFEPITRDEIKTIDTNFKQFSHVKQRLDASGFEEIMQLIHLKGTGNIPEEINEEKAEKYFEGTKTKITVNAYERNRKAREECIRIQGSECSICGIDFGKVYGDQFTGKIHVHHIKPLYEIDKHYEVDPLKDMVPVCPNCHMILHSKPGGTFTVDEVKKFLHS